MALGSAHPFSRRARPLRSPSPSREPVLDEYNPMEDEESLGGLAATAAYEGDSTMGEYLSDYQIDLAIVAEMERAGKAFAALGSYYEPRVTLVTRCGRVRHLWMTPDGQRDDGNKAGMAQAVRDREPAALVHTYWQADLFGHNSGIHFGAEVRVADACAMHVWFTEGFVPKGEGVYSPGRDAALVGGVSFNENDAERIPGLASLWPWTLRATADWVFASVLS